MYYKYDRKKEIIKNAIIIGFILFIAIFSIYNIYYKFSDNENIDYSSTSLDVTFHEENGEQLDITKATPLTDSVGLTSQPHTLTITNNLTESVRYKIKIVDNEEKIKNQNCEGITIPREEIRISIKESGKSTQIYNLSDLEENTILSTTTEALESVKYTIKIWVNNDSTLPMGSDHHYHGLIQVLENDITLASK